MGPCHGLSLWDVACQVRGVRPPARAVPARIGRVARGHGEKAVPRVTIAGARSADRIGKKGRERRGLRRGPKRCGEAFGLGPPTMHVRTKARPDRLYTTINPEPSRYGPHARQIEAKFDVTSLKTRHSPATTVRLTAPACRSRNAPTPSSATSASGRHEFGAISYAWRRAAAQSRNSRRDRRRTSAISQTNTMFREARPSLDCPRHRFVLRPARRCSRRKGIARPDPPRMIRARRPIRTVATNPLI